MPLDITRHPTPFLLITDPVVVRLTLPELLAATMQHSVRLASSRSLERFQKLGRRHDRPQEHVNVVCHDDERSKLVVSEVDSTVQRTYNDSRYAGLSQKLGARPGVIEIAVNPREGFSGSGFGGWREPAGEKTSMQSPCDEQPAGFGIHMGKTEVGIHENLVELSNVKSRVHPCERGTQECVRHVV